MAERGQHSGGKPRGSATAAPPIFPRARGRNFSNRQYGTSSDIFILIMIFIAIRAFFIPMAYLLKLW
jgi:hypothetical protein